MGLLFFILEAMTPGGMYLLCAVLVGPLDLLGVHLPFVIQGVIFVAISIVSLLLFRKPLLSRFQRGMPHGKVGNLVGETAKALEDLAVDAIGAAELRGAQWSARNVGPAPIVKGARCQVERVEGLMLHIRV